MAWGSKTSATQLTAITTEQFFDELITLNPRELTHVQVDVDFPGSPTDDCIIALYGTLDDRSEDWDDTPFREIAVSKDTDPNAVSFTVGGVYKFRIGARRSGSTDTFASADMSYRKDGVSL